MDRKDENKVAKAEVKIEVRKLDKIEATGHISKPLPGQ